MAVEFTWGVVIRISLDAGTQHLLVSLCMVSLLDLVMDRRDADDIDNGSVGDY